MGLHLTPVRLSTIEFSPSPLFVFVTNDACTKNLRDTQKPKPLFLVFCFVFVFLSLSYHPGLSYSYVSLGYETIALRISKHGTRKAQKQTEVQHQFKTRKAAAAGKKGMLSVLFNANARQYE